MSEVKWVVVERQNMSGRYVALRGVSYPTEAEAKQHIIDNFREGYRKKFHVESRAVKASEEGLRMTCQCCQRKILAKLGTISHHGYERPNGWGYQTASCMGAKELPFEVDRAALGKMLGYMRAQLARNEKYRAAIKSERLAIVFDYESQMIGPQRGVISRYNKWPVVKRSFDVTRESFEEFKKGPGSGSTYGIYEFEEYKNRYVAGLSRAIKSLKEHIAEEQARFDGWKATHEWKGDGLWAPLKKEKA